MKKALSVIVVFIALTNIVGFMPLYFSYMQEIKREVKLKLSGSVHFQKLEISDPDYLNPSTFTVTGEGEFKFMGQLYDSKTVQKTPGGYIIYALEDNKESELIDFISSSYGQFSENDKTNKSPFRNLLKNFSKDFVCCFPGQFNMLQPAIPSGKFSSSRTQSCSGYFSLITDPPETNC